MKAIRVHSTNQIRINDIPVPVPEVRFKLEFARLNFNELFDWLSSGQLQLTIDKIFPLSDVAAAHAYLKSRQAKGKVLLELYE